MWTLIGASKDPILNQKFAYEVEIYSPTDPSRLLLQRHACHSEKDEDILEPGRCASFLMGDIMRFTDKNKVSIYQFAYHFFLYLIDVNLDFKLSCENH